MESHLMFCTPCIFSCASCLSWSQGVRIVNHERHEIHKRGQENEMNGIAIDDLCPMHFFVCFVSFVVPQKQLFNASREKQND